MMHFLNCQCQNYVKLYLKMKNYCYCYLMPCTYTLYLFLTPFFSSISVFTPRPSSPPCSRQGQHFSPPLIKLEHLSRSSPLATFQVYPTGANTGLAETTRNHICRMPCNSFSDTTHDPGQEPRHDDIPSFPNNTCLSSPLEAYDHPATHGPLFMQLTPLEAINKNTQSVSYDLPLEALYKHLTFVEGIPLEAPASLPPLTFRHLPIDKLKVKPYFSNTT